MFPARYFRLPRRKLIIAAAGFFLTITAYCPPVKEVGVVEAQLSRVRSSSQNMGSAALSFTTDFSESERGYLSSVTVNFSAAPANSETIKVYLTSRSGSDYNSLLLTTTTAAGTTTNVTVLVYNAIPVGDVDQIKVTCTNNT